MPNPPSIWDWIKTWTTKNAAQVMYVPIPAANTDLDPGELRLEPYKSYFRLWLSEMFLSKRVSWGRERFPAVHSEVRLEFGGQRASFSRIAQPPADTLSEGVRLNYRLTELLPYNGGVVEVEAALLALKGSDYLGTAIGVLRQFSNLVAPPLGQALALVQTVATGTRDLLSATGGDVHLGFHQEWVSETPEYAANVLRPGYVAIIAATADEIAAERLTVRDGQLYHRHRDTDVPRHLEGHDYLLIRVEGRSTRDDYELQNIREPLDIALEALSEVPVNRARADAYLTVAVGAAVRSSDLVRHDRRRVVDAIRKEFAEVAQGGSGAVGRPSRDLNAIMAAWAIPVERAQALGELTEAEACDW